MSSQSSQRTFGINNDQIIIINSQDGTLNQKVNKPIQLQQEDTEMVQDDAQLTENNQSSEIQQINCSLQKHYICLLALLFLFFLILIVLLNIGHEKSFKVPYQTSSESLSAQIANEKNQQDQFQSENPEGSKPISDKSDLQPKEDKKIGQQSNSNQRPVQQSRNQIYPQHFPSLNNQYFPYECRHQENLFDYYHQKDDMLYFRTRYGIFFPVCYQNWETIFGRVGIEQWHREREVIEWSRKNIRKGDSVFYDCPNCRNFLDIVVLSHFVGPNGHLTLGNQQNGDHCFMKVRELHQLNNLKFTARSQKEYQLYDVVISLNENFFVSSITDEFLLNFPKKMIAKMNYNPTVVKKISDNKNLNIYKVNLNSSDCEGTLVFTSVDNQEGYYYIVRKDYQPREELQSINAAESSKLAQLRSQYQKFKEKLPQKSEIKDANKIIFTFPVQLSQLSHSQPEEKDWINDKVVIEWVRNRTKPGSTILYQLKSNNINVWSVLNLASLVPNGRLLLFCSFDSWQRVKGQADNLKITNINLIDQKTEGLFASCDLFISDNTQTIQKIIYQGLGDKYLLGHFSAVQAQRKLLYKLYTKYQIRKVDIFPSFYYGYQLFDHFFWHSEQPSGYFQIKTNKYTIFTFWSQSIKEITEGRKYNLKEIIRINTPEVKVINPTIRPYFVLPQVPVHKAFQYLSPVHQSDYLRNYFLTHYGGGYTDIKHMHFDMLPYFQKLHSSPSYIYAFGYHQRSPLYPTCVEMPGQSPCSQLKKNYLKMMGNGMYIHRHPSPIMDNFFKRTTTILDQKYEALKNNPARIPRDRVGATVQVNGRIERSSYPLRWQQINAECYGRAQWDNFGHTFVDMPYPIMFDYK